MQMPSSPGKKLERVVSIGVQDAKARTPLDRSTSTSEQLIGNIDSLRAKFGDRSPRRSAAKGHTLKKLTKGGSSLENLEVTLADEARAKGRARCRRPYAELRTDAFEGSTRTELLVYNDARAMYEAKVCFVKALPLVSRIHDLAGLGIGFELYCWQACTLATLLFLMGCASLPNLLWSASEAHAHYGVAAYPEFPSLTSLSLGMRSQPYPLLPSGLLELLCSTLLACYLVWLRWWNTTVARVNNRMHMTSADYTVEVSRLPVSVTADELRSYLVATLRCADRDVVAIELPTQDTVELAEESAKFAATWREAVEAKARKEQEAVKKPLSALSGRTLWAGLSRLRVVGWDRLDYEGLQEQLAAQHARVSKEYNEERAGGKASCGTAFVTFSTAELAQRAARTRSRGAVQMALLRLWARLCGKARHKALRYTAPRTPAGCGVVPAMERASEASDVCWENLRYQTWWGGWYPIAMQWVTNLLLLLLLLPVCGVVYGMTRYKLVLAGVIIRQPAIYVDGVLVYGEPDPWLVEWLLDRLLAALSYFGEMQVSSVTLLISVFVSTANFLLRELLYKLASYERSATSTAQQMRLFTLATCVYIASYVNLYYVYTEITTDTASGPDAASHVVHAASSALHAALDPRHWFDHLDLDRFGAFAVRAIDSSHWYGPSGLIPQVLVTTLTDGAMLVLNELAIVLPFMASRTLVGSVQVSQGRMDHYYDPPQFNVSKRYTYLVANAAIVILYGPASPLLYFIGAAALGLMLLVQKVLLVHCYRRPRVIDDAIAERAREMLGALMLLHVLSSAMFYLVSAKDTHSDASYVQAWPFYASGLVYLVYALFPFQHLMRRSRAKEDSGTGGRRWSEVASRMAKYKCVHTSDAQLHSRVTDKGAHGRPLPGAGTEHELPPYIQGFLAELCACDCACACAAKLLARTKASLTRLRAQLTGPTKRGKPRPPLGLL